MLSTSSLALAALATVSLQISAATTGGNSPQNSQYANQWTGLSKKCQQALSTIVDSKSKISICSGGGKLFNDIVSNSAVNADTSLVQFVEAWLKDDLCASDACSSSDVTAAYQQISSDCSAELDKQAYIPMGAQAVLLNYENTRKAACLIDPVAKDNATSYCPAEIMHNVETSGTIISYASLQKNMDDPKGWITSLPPWTYCNQCFSGILNGAVMGALKVINPDWEAHVKTTMEKQCGAGFASGSVPNPLIDGTANDDANSSGAGGNSTGGAGGAGSADGSGGDGSSAGFRIQASLANSAVLLLTVGTFALVRL